MTLILHAHPFSSYCQKALVALYENATPFTFKLLEGEASMRELAELWPIKRFPILVDEGRTVVEATSIIEYLDAFHPGPRPMIPDDRRRAVEPRMMDRFFDNYISTPQQKLVFDLLRPAADRDAFGVAEARALLDVAYVWLDTLMAAREWAAGEHFGLADCAAAPALFYADWSHPIPDSLANVQSYRQRLLARPSFARAVDEARPYRGYFPGGAPERD